MKRPRTSTPPSRRPPSNRSSIDKETRPEFASGAFRPSDRYRLRLDGQVPVKPVKTEEGHDAVALTRQGLASAALTVQDFAAERGQVALDLQRQHAIADGAAPLHSRSRLLTDETALGEVDAVQQVKVGLDRIGGVPTAIAGGVGDAERQTVVVPVRGLVRRGEGLAVVPVTEGGKARVGGAGRVGRGRPQDLDRAVNGRDRDLGA